MSQSLANPYFLLYILALGGSVEQIGLITAVGGLAGLILYPLGGYVADMKGRVKLVGFSTFAWAASFIFLARAPYFGGFLIDRVFGGDLVPALHIS
jgi:MFS family permease